MKLDRALNVVLQVDGPKGSVWVHATPIGRAVFERYFLAISKAFIAIYEHGAAFIAGAGPRIALLTLRKVSTDMGIWESAPGMLDGVENGLMGEIRRLANVLVPASAGGWETIPFHEAKARGYLDDTDAAEVESFLVFFTLIWSMHRRAEAELMLTSVSEMLGLLTTSLTPTDYANSLQTSTGTDSTTSKAKASSIPS